MTNKALALSLAVAFAAPCLCRGQVGGNIGFSQAGGRAKAEQAEQAKRTLPKDDLPPSGTSTFVDANVLMNLKADEYVAVFSVAREGKTVAECVRLADETIKGLAAGLKDLGIGGEDVDVDFVTQTRTYGYELEGRVAREKPVGFELKKNVSVRFSDKALLDKLVVVAAKAEVFDLVKVDYVVKDKKGVRDRLIKAAAEVVKRKSAQYEELLGVTLKGPGQVYADRPAAYYPSSMYDSYTAIAAESVSVPFDRQSYAIQSARKSATFFFNPLDGDGFDEVINPVVVEPVVQFTLYLKVRYEVEQAKAR